MHIDHITIRTEKLEGSIVFYEMTAGLKIVRDLRKIDAQIVFLADADGDTRIELIEAPAGRGFCGSGISIGFHTDDAAGLREELKAKLGDITKASEGWLPGVRDRIPQLVGQILLRAGPERGAGPVCGTVTGRQEEQ